MAENNISYLVLNGITDKHFLYQRLAGKKDIYCADGGYAKLLEAGVNADAIIGDLDSIMESGLVADGLPKIIHSPDQNYTDFEKALKYLMHEYRQVDVYGASGGSPDHILGNLSIAKEYKDMVTLRFYDAGMCYFFLNHDTTLRGVKGKTISVLPFPKVYGLNYEGLEYGVYDATFELGGNMGIRNKAVDETVKITYKGGTAIIFVED